jgi:hypothetical protein
MAFSEQPFATYQKSIGKKMGVQKVACKNGSFFERSQPVLAMTIFGFCKNVISTSKLLTSKNAKGLNCPKMVAGPPPWMAKKAKLMLGRHVQASICL